MLSSLASRASAGGQLEQPSEVKSSTRTGVRLAFADWAMALVASSAMLARIATEGRAGRRRICCMVWTSAALESVARGWVTRGKGIAVKQLQRGSFARMAGPAGIYISVPFCKAKCSFCNFASGVYAADRMQRYVERVCEEIRVARAAAERLGARLPGAVDTVYFGGGTPSLLSGSQFRGIFQALRGEFEVARDAEITLECAPGQLSDETLAELLRQGMNRISFGVQSFVDRGTAPAGGLHTGTQCE